MRGLRGRPVFLGPGGGVKKSRDVMRAEASPLGCLFAGGYAVVVIGDFRLRPAPLRFFRGRPRGFLHM